MAKPDLGTKRVCPETGKKFYDLHRDPIVSPFTGIEYQRSFFEEAVVASTSKKAPKPEANAEEDTKSDAAEEADGFEDEADDTPEVDVAAEQLPDSDDDDDDDNGEGSGLSDDIADDFEEDEIDGDDEDDNTTVLIDEEDDEDFGDFNIDKEEDL
ncbi:MAG: TIGR02300 family protein [Alphaproteobacteria bacterium]|nr:TIGR02300 family protein [Alphaproteobacteria bacterium]